MRKDEPSEAAPASALPETEAIDSSWDDDDDDGPELSVEIEVLEAEESLEDVSIHERVTAMPDPELVLESGFHEIEPPTEDMLAPPRVPDFGSDPELPHIPALAVVPRRPPSAELDDPLAHLEPDLDITSPSDHPIPITDRITPVQEPPRALLELELDPGAAEPPGDQAVVQDMKERYAVGDFTGALAIAESILDANAEHTEAKRYAQSCRDVLVQMYAARLGSLGQVVSVALPSDQIRWLSLDHRAGFLLSLVDGSSSVEEILDICGMARLDALRILYTLHEQRVISLSPRE